MADDKETARKLGEPIVVFLHADVCKTGPLKVPVPYPIIAPLSSSIDIAATVRATQVPTFAMKSSVPLVIGDEAGSGGGVVSGTFAGTGSTFPTGSSSNVRAEKSLLIRNGDPFAMNGGNTSGMLVYQPGGAPKGQVDAGGTPRKNPNPPVKPTKREQGYLDWLTDKAGEALNATSDAAEKAYDIGKKLNEDYAIVPRLAAVAQGTGGIAEMGLGALGMAAPTGVTQVLGGGLVLHGADTTGAAIRQGWTGKWQDTLTKQAAANAAQALGASESTADMIGEATDLVAGLALPATVGKKLLSGGGVRVVKSARPSTAHVKYPKDMTPYQHADGTWKYPDNRGFAGASKDEILQPGTKIDRYGGDNGNYFSPAGTPYEGRGLPPDSLTKDYSQFEVMRQLPTDSGRIAPAFGQPGGGTQFITDRSVNDLLKSGHIRRLP